MAVLYALLPASLMVIMSFVGRTRVSTEVLLFAFCVGALHYLLQKRTEPWALVGKSLTRSALIGIGLACLVPCVFVLLDTHSGVDEIGAWEERLYQLSKSFTSLTHLRWWQVTLILSVLLIINHYLPNLRLVSKFKRLKATTSVISKVLMIATMFTYSTGAGAIGPRVGDLTMRLKKANEEYNRSEEESLAQIAAIRQIKTAITGCPQPLLSKSLKDLFESKAEKGEPELRRDAVIRMSRLSAEELQPKQDEPAESRQCTPEDVKNSQSRERVASNLLSEEREGLKMILSETFGAGSQSLLDYICDFIFEIVGERTKVIEPLLRQYLQKTGRKYTESLTKESMSSMVDEFENGPWKKLWQKDSETLASLGPELQSRIAQEVQESNKKGDEAAERAKREILYARDIEDVAKKLNSRAENADVVFLLRAAARQCLNLAKADRETAVARLSPSDSRALRLREDELSNTVTRQYDLPGDLVELLRGLNSSSAEPDARIEEIAKRLRDNAIFEGIERDRFEKNSQRPNATREMYMRESRPRARPIP